MKRTAFNMFVINKRHFIASVITMNAKQRSNIQKLLQTCYEERFVCLRISCNALDAFGFIYALTKNISFFFDSVCSSSVLFRLLLFGSELFRVQCSFCSYSHLLFHSMYLLSKQRNHYVRFCTQFCYF